MNLNFPFELLKALLVKASIETPLYVVSIFDDFRLKTSITSD